MESGFKWPCFSYAHWPGLAGVIPAATQCLFGDGGWMSGVLREVCAQMTREVTARVARKAPGGMPGAWGERREPVKH